MKKEEPIEVDLCLTPDCGKPAKWKGLCQSCYGCAKNLIDKNETTWDELVQLGLADIPAKVFYKAFKERKKSAQVNQEDSKEETRPEAVRLSLEEEDELDSRRA